MAAPHLGIPREAGVPPNNLKSFLLDFAKFQKANPNLTPNECANLFSGAVPVGYSAVPFQGIPVASDLKAVDHKSDSSPGGPQLSAPPPESQRMSHSNSTSSYLGTAPTAQQAFARMSGRSPGQFQVSTSVTCRPDYHETTLPQKAPSFDDIQSVLFEMDSSGSLAIADYLSQQDRSEPFPLVRHSVGATATGFCDDSMGGDSFSIDDSSGVCAPRMQPQLSSSTSGCYTGGDESSHPMTRHSRSYSNASYRSRSSCLSSQGESTSPTDRFSYTQNSWAPMSRQTSNASLTHGAMMLRLSSSTGNSTSGSGGGDYDPFCGQGNVDAMLGLISTEVELSSSLDKATGQHMLKRAPSTSVEDLDQSLAIAAEHEMQRNPSTTSEGVKPRKPKRVKENTEPTAPAQNEEVSATITIGRGMLEKEGQGHQAPRMEDLGPPARCQNPTTTDKTTHRESGDGMGSIGSLPANGRMLVASKPDKSGPKCAAVLAAKSPYVRTPHPRVHCKLCNECPDGFRGDHELRRHMEREHAPIRKMFFIKDISEDGQFLAKCKACQSGKKYGQDYNAAAHLRRQHFSNGTDEKKKKGSFDTSSPGMAELRKWMEEVQVDNAEHAQKVPQATDVSGEDSLRESVSEESSSADEGEGEFISQVPNSGSAVTENNPAPEAVIQDAALGVSNIPTQHQTPFDSFIWEQFGNLDESGGACDLSHRYGIEYSVSGGSMALTDALDSQNNGLGGQNDLQLPLMQLLQGRQAIQPTARGGAANTIFGNLPGPVSKDTSGMFSNNGLTTMIPGGPGPIFGASDLQFS